MSRSIELQFANLAASIVPPHMPFQRPLPITLTLDFGNGRITSATYQVLGDNNSESTLYMQGGGGISIPGNPSVLTGAAKLVGNIHYQPTPQRLETEYNGTVQIRLNENQVTLVATLYAVGQGPLLNKSLQAKLNGSTTSNQACGIKTVVFGNNSLKLAVLLPE